MVKQHTVRLTVENQSGFTMNFKGDWYSSGRLADTYKWPQTIKDGRHMDILSYERDNSLSGCSGYTKYDINGTIITFAFSNPTSGKNKLGVGIGGKTVWDDMNFHDYREFTIQIPVCSVNLRFVCKCTGSTTNHATVTIYHMWNDVEDFLNRNRWRNRWRNISII